MTEKISASSLSQAESRKWAMFCHLAALVGLLGNGIGFLAGPLVVWLIKKDADPFVDEQGKEAVNFQITMFIACFICAPLILIVVGIFLLIAIGIMISPAFVRIVHSSTLSTKENDYVLAARAIGVSQTRMVRVHILPNILGEAIVLASIYTATAIRVEANLSFIGLGVSPPTPAWGTMIREGTQYLTIAPWISIFPGLAILVTVLAFNLLGDGMRDIMDPKSYS